MLGPLDSGQTVVWRVAVCVRVDVSAGLLGTNHGSALSDCRQGDSVGCGGWGEEPGHHQIKYEFTTNCSSATVSRYQLAVLSQRTKVVPVQGRVALNLDIGADEIVLVDVCG